MSDTVWVVFRFANYRHECGGVFSSEAKARAAIAELVKTEPDGHHGYELMQCDIDVKSERHTDGHLDVGLDEPISVTVIEPFRREVRA